MISMKVNSMDQSEKPVVFESNGLQIVGMLHSPVKNSTKNPAVLLLHGFTGNKSENHFLFTKLARKLAEAGYVCLRFDFTGSGDSQGNFKDMSIFTELDDAKAALQFLSQQSQVDTNRIGLLGLSMGGCVAALLAGENDRIKSLILLSAVANPEETFQALLNNSPKTYFNNNNWYIDFSGYPVGQKFFEILPEVKPLEKIRSFQGSVYIIHGKEDAVVPLSSADDFHNALNIHNKNSAIQIEIIPGADHVFTSVPLTNLLIGKIVKWFNKTLK